MRKLFAFIALLLLPCLLLSCFDGNPEIVETGESSSDSAVVELPETTVEGKLNSDKTLSLLDSLSEYLTNEGYTDTDQEALTAIVSKYSYQGTSLPELYPAAVYEGTDNSGGMSGGDGTIGYRHHFSYPESGKSVRYNNFCTQVPLEGMVLPFEISFEDTVSDVLKKLGLDFSPDYFAPDDPRNRMKATLLTLEESSLVFYNYHYSDLADYEDKYALLFKDIYYFVRWDGAKFPYTRELSLYFDDSGKLCRVLMQISSR